MNLLSPDDITVDWLTKKYEANNDKELGDKMTCPVNTIKTWRARGVPDRVKIDIFKKFQNEIHKKEYTDASSTINITILSHNVSAGTDTDVTDIEVLDTNDVITVSLNLFKTPQNSKFLRAAKVDGYSMIPILMPDSIVIFDTHKNVFAGDGLYVLIWRNVMMVKILQLTNKGQLLILSKNQDYQSWEIDPDDQSVFKILGKVVKTII
ncbi:MAG: S24 family peptidase [Campylobacteraceae bacterium]|nr:S24 family peptidase [Campylobacteraceae bacterium]